ncbi:hypothetical protein DFH29DRAFT_815690 [Suillus ampliporus]|nr:hypothetical protein DFH29DRAFT_815690 [Suillus ampliporus]
MISIHWTPTERLMQEWNSQVYAFFHLIPKISEQNGRRAHEFRCQCKGCKATVRRYLNKGDARSTGNLRKHVRSCWGEDILKVADEVKDVDEVQKNIVGSVLRNRSITVSFERKGKGKITYSHRQHTRAETRYRFQSLMKTGQPEYYLPSPSTVSRDVRLVFARTHQRIAKMTSEYEGKINFSTDGWTSPNHRALVAVLAHLEFKGEPLCLLLDIVEVPKVKITYEH